jgi:BirA family biotin operon repressor/biotin-[acetyl-CoA-carboxylase] ligase
MNQLLEQVDQVLSEHEQDVWSYYKTHLYRRAGWYPFEDQNGQFEARIEDVLPTGEIVLRDKQGNQRKYQFKQIRYVL